MAKRVTAEDIKLINEIYYKTKSYAETARQTGWSASTVRELCGNLDGKTAWDLMLETLGNKMYDCVTI